MTQGYVNNCRLMSRGEEVLFHAEMNGNGVRFTPTLDGYMVLPVETFDAQVAEISKLREELIEKAGLIENLEEKVNALDIDLTFANGEVDRLDGLLETEEEESDVDGTACDCPLCQPQIRERKYMGVSY